ncbi:aldose 1-epimerase family protein [Microlunatus elymi]|uniref:Aldose 1-epimerase family protein n=1 Tax=Microlunatus elymi TaxID=2596828 RepID=A0A516Q158_9ACTN|nr:aldose 1-epimerase family protein [Microlunatus elymi]QDP97169.1 aldose 1-epimerase family protein [Microlunatus elymi]
MTASVATSPTGHQYEISSGSYRAVVTELGATLRRLQVDGRDLIAGFGAGDRVAGGRGQQLMPWPNRIRDGRYSFGGEDHELPLSEPERHNAIHGLVRWVGWELVSHTADTVTQQVTVFPQKGWDSTIRCTLTHQLSDRGLTVTVGCDNVGDRAVPFGYAAHPYFTLGEQSVDEIEITAPAGQYLKVDDRLLPVSLESVDGLDEDLRTAAPLGSRNFDTAFTELAGDEQGRWRIRLARSDRETYIWADQHHRWTQIYTGDDRRDIGLAVEPMTCGPDAFNSELTADGLVILEPGASYHGVWGIYGR